MVSTKEIESQKELKKIHSIFTAKLNKIKNWRKSYAYVNACWCVTLMNTWNEKQGQLGATKLCVCVVTIEEREWCITSSLLSLSLHSSISIVSPSIPSVCWLVTFRWTRKVHRCWTFHIQFIVAESHIRRDASLFCIRRWRKIDLISYHYSRRIGEIEGRKTERWHL